MNEGCVGLFILAVIVFLSLLGRCDAPVSQLEADIAPPITEKK
jgi:hypothetical protein